MLSLPHMSPPLSPLPPPLSPLPPPLSSLSPPSSPPPLSPFSALLDMLSFPSSPLWQGCGNDRNGSLESGVVKKNDLSYFDSDSDSDSSIPWSVIIVGLAGLDSVADGM